MGPTNALALFATPSALDEKRGIAALAAGSELVDERNDVEYFDLPCRSVLNRCTARSMPFDFTINPYRGCEFGCAYCYARSTHEYLDLSAENDFERKVFVKKDAPRVLARELARAHRARGQPFRRSVGLGPIAIGTATDPYQPAERRLGITRGILAEIARYEGLSLSITTKSDLVLRDADLLQEISKRSSVHVNVTITTLDAELARLLEPRAPHPEKRMAAVAALSEKGIQAGVFCMPILPFLTDDPVALRRLMFRAKEAGARFFSAQVLFLRAAAKPTFMPWLESYRPELVRVYRNLYGSSAYASFQVADKIRRLVEALRRQYGLPRSPRHDERKRDEARVDPTIPPADPQLSLFPSGCEPAAASAASLPQVATVTAAAVLGARPEQEERTRARPRAG